VILVVAGGKGDVVINISGEFTGSTKVPVARFPRESVTVTLNETDATPEGGVPVNRPLELSFSHLGSPVADHA
jgi:hypothetical protein